MNFQTLSKPSNRWTLALMVAATAITGTTVFYGISQFKQTSQPIEPTQTVPVVKNITALGRLEPTAEVIRLSVPASLSSDRVAKLLVQRGDSVKANQVIAILASQKRLQTVLLEAQAQVKVSRSELARVKAGAKSGEIAAREAEIFRLQEQLKGETATQKATIARYSAEVRTASADYNRYLSLYKQGAIAVSQLDQRRLTLETAQTQLDEAKARENQSVNTLREQIRQARATLNQTAEVRSVDVEVAQADVEKAIAAVKTAEADLAEAYIRAPSSGRILDIYAKPGEVVDSEGIASLGQTSQMQVVAEVYQTDIGKVREGQQAIITSESFPEQLRGTVYLTGLQVIQQQVTSGEPGENLDRKVIEVRIRLNSKDSQRIANLTNLQVQVAIQPST